MNKSIMVVEDSLTMLQMLSFTLKKNGYDVVEANNGQEALEKLNNRTEIDMIMTDINMPNVDGIEFIHRVRENPDYKFTPIIVLTTESQEGKKMEGKEAGATGWLVKPFSPEHLISVVKKLLNDAG